MDASIDDLLTAKEVGKIVRLHPVTVLKKSREGEIERVRTGRKVLFRRSAVLEFLARGTESATEPPAVTTAPASPALPARPARNPNRRYKN